MIRKTIALLLFVAPLVIQGCTSDPFYRARRRSQTYSKGFYEVGWASYYGQDFHGKPTASGEPFDMHALTAAHNTLPFGTRIRVTNLENGLSVIVRINDRGPSVKGRILDLSYGAALEIGMVIKGIVEVRIDIVGHAR
jgi:rare lipoprotein A